jgi:steroid delta-isomerase
MTMTHDEARSRGAEWARAWNARDIEAVLSHFTDDVTFLSPVAADVVGTAELRGKPALRAYWERALARITRLHFTVERVLWDAEAQELVVLYLAELDDRRMRACERMKLDPEGRVIFAEALYGARAVTPQSGS